MAATAFFPTPFDPLVRRRTVDLAASLAGGLGIGGPVALVFTGSFAAAGVALGALAFGLTALTVGLAGRSRNDARAVLVVFLGCFLPPTVLFAPTGIGLVYAAPAGLLASFVVLPLVLALRATNARPRDDDGEQLAVVTALWLLVIAVATILLTARPPGVVLALLSAAALLVGLALARDLRRAAFVAAVRSGRLPGLVLVDGLPGPGEHIRVQGRSGLAVLRLVERSGSGPFRVSSASVTLGAVRTPIVRIVLAAALFAAVGWLAVVLLAA